MAEEWRDIPGFAHAKIKGGGNTAMIQTTVKYTDGSVASMALEDWDAYCDYVDSYADSIEEAHGELIVVEDKN